MTQAAPGHDPAAKKEEVAWITPEVLKEFENQFQDSQREGVHEDELQPSKISVSDNSSMRALLDKHGMTDHLFKKPAVSTGKDSHRMGHIASRVPDPVSLEQMRERLAKEKEITLKEKSLHKSWAGAETVTRLIASVLPGGSPSDPLALFHKMNKEDLERLCQEKLQPMIVQTLLEIRITSVEQNRRQVQIATNDKFSAPRTAVFGPIEDYFKGILDRIGYPSTELMRALEDEHCNRDDSDDFFIPGNYQGFTTTPKTEYKSVTDSAEASKLTQAGKDGRKITFWSTLLEHTTAKEAGLRKEEIIALQLYTGPLFMKYNTVLRDDPPELVKGLKDNKYTTTIFLIVSGIIKLSKIMEIPKDRCVWRGLKNLSLQDAFLTKDKTGVRGGVERAMMSTSLQKSVAISYAGAQEPMLFKIDIGAIDRGADVGFLSQYPREKEIIFPPASFVEVVGEPFLDQLDGTWIRVVPLKINSNQVTKTIDDFLQHRKKLHVSMLTNFQAEIKHELNKRMVSEKVSERLEHDAFCVWGKHHVQLKDSILSECKRIVSLYEKKVIDEYNDDNEYTKIMKATLGMRTMATLKFDFWRDNASVQAFRLKELPLKKVERSVMAQMRCQYIQAKEDKKELKKDKIKSEEAEKKAQKLALEICKLRECCVMEVDEIVNELGETPLITASAEGMLVNLKYIINAGSTKINHQSADGATALMVAAAGGYQECCEYLIKHKASLDLQNKDGETCLYLACENGHLAVAEFLVKQNRDLLYKARTDGVSCIWIASKNGHVKVVKYLVEEGGQRLILMKRQDQASALNLAAQNNHLDVVKILVNAGKKALKKNEESLALAQDKNNITPLWIACSNGHADVAAHLLTEGSIMDEKDGSRPAREKLVKLKHKESGQNALHIACKNGALKTVELLCQNVGNKDDFLFEVDKTGANCFGIAVKNGHGQCAEFLLKEAGTRRDELFEARLKDGKSCLHQACESGSLPLLRSLLKKGTDELMLEKDRRGATCLHQACESGRKECVEHLLEKQGTDVLKERLHDGTTVLHLCCKSGKAKLFDFLMGKEAVRAMLMEQDDNGITPLWLACSEGKDEIVERILNLERDTKSRGGSNELELNQKIKQLLKIRDKQGRNCLQIASEKMQLKVIKSLYAVQDFSVLSEKNDEGATCFHIVCAKGFTPGAKSLLSMSRNMQWIDTLHDGRNCVHLACEANSLELLQFLKDKIGRHGSLKEHVRTAKEGGTSAASSRRSSVSSTKAAGKPQPPCKANSPIKKPPFVGRKQQSEMVDAPNSNSEGSDSQNQGDCKTESAGPQSLFLEQDKDGITPLWIACSKGNKMMVSLLLEAAEESRSLKKLLDLRHDDGRSCLHIASAKGHAEIVQDLIEHGCVKEISHPDERGVDCFGYACEQGGKDVAEKLYTKAVQKQAKEGAEEQAQKTMLFPKRLDGKSCLHAVCKSGSEDLFNFVVEKMGTDLNLDEKDNDGKTCLYEACENGRLKVAKLLVERKKELLMTRTTDGTSCLAIAAANGHEDLVEFLVKKVSKEMMRKVRHKDQSGALHLAATNGHLDVVKKLIDALPDLAQQRDKDGATPLLHSCWKGHVDIVRFFLEDEVVSRTNLKDIMAMKHKDGRTCLHIDSQQNCLEILQVLCSKGGEQHLFEVDSQGETAFAKECKKGHFKCARFLLERGSKADGGRRMLEAKNKDGKSCLMLSCNNYELLRFLAKKVSPDRLLTEKDNSGGTCFSSACAYGNLQCARFLVAEAKESELFHGKRKQEVSPAEGERKASEELEKDPLGSAAKRQERDAATDSEGRTREIVDLEPFLKGELAGKRTNLHLAVEKAPANGNLQFFEYLLDVYWKQGMYAELTAQDVDGRTPLWLACSRGHIKLFDLMYRYKPLPDAWGFENLMKMKTKDGVSPLHIAARNGHLDVIYRLCDAGREGDDSEEKDFAQDGIQKLVDHIFEPDTRGGNCVTSAFEKADCEPSKMEVVLKQKVKCARFLFEQVAKQGVEAEIESIEQKLRTLVSVGGGGGDAAGITRIPSVPSSAPKLSDEDLEAANRAGLKAASKLLEAKFEGDVSVMHLACNSEGPELLEFLIRETSAPSSEESDSDPPLWRTLVMSEDSNSATPLWLACSQGNLSIVTRLLKALQLSDQVRGTNDLRRMLGMKHGNGQSCLHAAAVKGNLEVVSKLCDNGCDNVFEVDASGATPFLRAVEKGNIRCAEFLLGVAQDRRGEIGAAQVLERENDEDRTCVHMACELGSAELCLFLIEKGGMKLLKRKDKDGKMPLSLFGEDMVSPCKIVEKMIRLKMQSDWKDIVKAKDKDGRSCLHFLSKEGNLKALKELSSHLEVSELCSDADKLGRTSFLIACETGHESLVRFLLDQKVGRGCLDNRMLDGKTCLHLAALSKKNGLQILQFLLRRGVDKLLTQTDKSGQSCFSSACAAGSKDMAEFLLKKMGREVLRQKLVDDRTCLHLAAESGPMELLQFLIDETKTTLVDALSDTLQVAVHSLVKRVSSSSLDDAKSKRASPSAAATDSRAAPQDFLLQMDKRGATCFSSACEKGNLDCAVLLLDKRPDMLHHVMDDGRNCLHLAVQSGSLPLYRALWEKGADKFLHETDKGGNLPLALANKKFSKGFLELFRKDLGEDIEIGGNANQPKSPENTPKPTTPEDQKAAIENCSGEDLFQEDADGRNCIHKACFTGDVETFKAVSKKLVEMGKKADDFFRLKDKRGQTCMHAVCAGGHVDLFEHLRELGGEELLKDVDNDGLTPLLLACKQGKSEILSCLLKDKVPVKEILKFPEGPRTPTPTPMSTPTPTPTKSPIECQSPSPASPSRAAVIF